MKSNICLITNLIEECLIEQNSSNCAYQFGQRGKFDMLPHISFITGSFSKEKESIKLVENFSKLPLEKKVFSPDSQLTITVYGFCEENQSIQELIASNKNHTLAFCGKIYNLEELISKATQYGVNSEKPNIAQSFLSLYINDKKWLLENINAKFCAAIYNGKKLVLMRDKIGEEQIYFGISKNNLVFSSAIKDIIMGLGLNKFLVSESAIAFETPIEDETMFKGIYKVEHGTEVTIDLNNMKIKKQKYWKIKSKKQEQKSDQEHIQKFLWLIKDAIKIRLPDSKNASAFLSGGQDSSFVSMILAKYNKKPTRVYTTAWKDLDSVYNESPWASLVAKAIGSEHIILQPCPEDFKAHYPITMQILDEVKANAAHFIEYWIAKEAANRGDKFLFSGYGADEILGGEIRYLVMYLDRNRKKNSHLFDSHPLLKNYKPLMQKLSEINQDSEEVEKYFHLIKRANVKNEKKLFKTVKKYFKEFNQLIDQMGATDIAISGQPLLDSTKLTKYFGIDKVCPFLDYRVVEFAFNLPEHLKINELTTKNILRMASRGIVPDQITDRTDKVGFAFPHNDDRYAGFLQQLAKELEKRTGQKIREDTARGRYDRTILMAASQEILRKIYEDNGGKL